MSGNRIRYEKHPTRENSLISLNDYVSERTNARYKIVLDLDKMIFGIRNERSKEFIFVSKPYTNLNVLKRTARSKLESLGIKLSRESRDRTFGVVEKGYTQKIHEQNDN